VSGLSDHWPPLLAAEAGLRDRLTEAYDEPHRGYHNRQHLAEVFARIDTILAAGPGIAVDRDAVLLAAWFHDAVYDHDADNEERSAELAEHELTAAGVEPSLVAEVARLVRLTTSHAVAADDPGGQVLCDADLGILAAEEPRYTEYTDGVRGEYQHVGDADFRRGRALILRGLLDLPSLFNTGFAREHWEALARANLERELAALEG
jgi:predicted metal-dependent HD superfamily phosphohydrolase